MQLKKLLLELFIYYLCCYIKLILIFLFSFQSIQIIPIDYYNYYYESSKSILHILYKNKIEQYALENDVEIISSKEIKNLSEYDLSKKILERTLD